MSKRQRVHPGGGSTLVIALIAAALNATPAAAGQRPLKPWLVIKASAPTPAPRIINWTAQPTYAIAPRTSGITYGSRYFVRQAYAGPARRGQAFNVRRRTS